MFNLKHQEIEITTKNGTEIFKYRYHIIHECLDFIVFYPQKKFNKYLLFKFDERVSVKHFLAHPTNQLYIKDLLKKVANSNDISDEVSSGWRHSFGNTFFWKIHV